MLTRKGGHFYLAGHADGAPYSEPLREARGDRPRLLKTQAGRPCASLTSPALAIHAWKELLCRFGRLLCRFGRLWVAVYG